MKGQRRRLIADRRGGTCSTGIFYRAATALFSRTLPLNGLSLESILPSLDPLKNLLRTLGISVEHLVEGLKKCVDELGPEASTSVKKLLVTTSCETCLLKGRA